MNPLAVPILLQRQYTWTLRILRIVLHDDGVCYSLDDVSHKNVICRQFIIAMVRYSDFSAIDQVRNPLKRLTHPKSLGWAL